MSKERRGRAVGRVAGLWRYPVKSMGAEALREIDVSWHGLAGDRRWAFVRSDAVANGFPWVTLRQNSAMNHYLPSFVDPGKPNASATVVKTPSGEVKDITDPALASELYPDGASLIKQDRGVFDTFPMSLISTQTIARLGEIVGTELDVLRFRPNILIESNDGMPFVEDEWVGKVLRIGEMQMRVDQRDGRCVVITLDPETGHSNGKILKAVREARQGCLGVYGSIVQPGRIRIDDPVHVQ